MVKTQYRVDIIEYERGWGQKIDEQKFFQTKELALNFIKEYNARNNETEVPDWYMVARGPYEITYDTEPINCLKKPKQKIIKISAPKVYKGGTNPTNTSSKRPSPPKGSGI